MATQIADRLNQPITTDDTFFWNVAQYRPHFVKVTYLNGATGTVQVQDAQGDVYQIPSGGGNMDITAASATKGYEIRPTGGIFQFVTTGVSGGDGIVISVIMNDTTK